MNSDTVKARRLHLDDDFWTVSGGSLYIDTRGEGYELGSGRVTPFSRQWAGI